MKLIKKHRKFESAEAYFAFEEKSGLRHAYFLENLIETTGSSKLHNQIVFFLTLLFRQVLLHEGFDIYSKQVKAFIKSENIFFYPDVMVALPEENPFYNSQPLLIAEVLSESTRKFDMVDKFIQYQKLETLQYYLLVEPDKQMVIIYKKTEDNEWQASSYASIADIIELPKLNISIALKDIYQA